MKSILSIILISVVSAVYGQSRAEATFETKAQQFHDVEIGTQLRVVYYFKNTGGSPLILNKVKPTCGCTVAKYPEYPILPGQRDSITATFDTNKRLGYNAKGINIESTVGPISLVFEAFVIDPNEIAPAEYSEEVKEEEDHSGHNH